MLGGMKKPKPNREWRIILIRNMRQT